MPKLSLLAIALLGISLAGCAARIDSAHFGPPGAIERLVMRYYERNASEGNCFNPYIDGFTQLTVVADAPDRLVVDARYFFRDRFKNGGNGGGGDGCTGFAERTFKVPNVFYLTD